MKFVTHTAVVALVFSFGSMAFAGSTIDLSAAKKNSVYAAKKAECKQEAKTKNFGIHLIQKNRWIKECIAGNKT